MSQLALDLLSDVAPTLDNFVPGSNLECLQRLRELREGRREHRFIYLWGLPGCGRSHLARAMALRGSSIFKEPEPAAPDLLVVDDVQNLDPDEQVSLFRRFIAAAAHPQRAIVTTGDRPPLALALRDDLRSRLGAGLVFEVQAPNDTDRAHALELAAQARGLTLPPDLIPWLLTHHSRDMRVLLATFNSLDRFALARKRPITLPLLREWIALPVNQRPQSAGKIS